MEIQKTVFISYRRTNIALAQLVRFYLANHGFDVFFDYSSLDSGAFSQNILQHIASRAHFVLILTPSALERCVSPDDWVRKEIEEAIRLKRNIVPIFFENFKFEQASEYLKGNFLPLLPEFNGLNIHWDYLDEGLDRLRERFLNKPLELVPHPIPRQTQITEPRVPSSDALKAQEHFERGFSLATQAKFDAAIAEYDQAIALEKAFAEAYYRRGLAFWNKGEKSKGLTDWEKAVEIDPKHPKVNFMMTDILGEKGMLEEALKEAEKGVSIYPDLDEAYFGRAFIYHMLNNYEKALEDYNKAIELNPHYAISYMNRGIIFYRQNDYASALMDYDKAVEFNPNYALTYINRANLYYKQKNYYKALENCNKAIEINPDFADAYSNRGTIYEELKDYELALDDFKKALSFNPKKQRYIDNLKRLEKLLKGAS
jgi:tetratricopeptide (TPR) repeat protein